MFVMTSTHDRNEIKPAIIFASANFIKALLRAERELGTTDVAVYELGSDIGVNVTVELGDNGEYEQDLT